MVVNLNDALNEIVKMFDHINRELYGGELPTPMLCVQSGGRGAKNRLGWFSLRKIWVNKDTGESRHEISLTAEYLKRPIAEIYETLCHESTHLYNCVNNIVDYKSIHHNKRFKKTAEEHGLDVKYSNDVGWAFTSLNKIGWETYNRLEVNNEAFQFAREFDSEEKPEKEKSIYYKYRCFCGTKISRKTELNIFCNDCQSNFTLMDEEEEGGL